METNNIYLVYLL